MSLAVVFVGRPSARRAMKNIVIVGTAMFGGSPRLSEEEFDYDEPENEGVDDFEFDDNWPDDDPDIDFDSEPTNSEYIELMLHPDGWVYPQEDFSEAIQEELDFYPDVQAWALYRIPLGSFTLTGHFTSWGDYYEELEAESPTTRQGWNLTRILEH